MLLGVLTLRVNKDIDQATQLLQQGELFLRTGKKFCTAASRRNNYTSKESNKWNDHKSSKKWGTKINITVFGRQGLMRMNILILLMLTMVMPVITLLASGRYQVGCRTLRLGVQRSREPQMRSQWNTGLSKRRIRLWMLMTVLQLVISCLQHRCKRRVKPQQLLAKDNLEPQIRPNQMTDLLKKKDLL